MSQIQPLSIAAASVKQTEVNLTHGFYTYVHRRASDGSIFYVGMGSGFRAKAKSGRSKEWLEVAAQHGRVVQVFERFETPREAAQAEIETIDLLGQMGVRLINRSNGGEGGPAHKINSFEEAFASTKAMMAEMEKARVLRMAIQRWRDTVLYSYYPPRRRGASGLPARCYPRPARLAARNTPTPSKSGPADSAEGGGAPETQRPPPPIYRASNQRRRI
jgi:hypothetical protein